MPFVAFALMGAVVIQSQPRHRVGWAMAGTTLVPLGLALIEAGQQAYGRSPTWSLAGWFAGQLLFKLGFAAVVFMLLLFPEGRLPDARWRVVLGLTALLVLASEASTLVAPGRIDDGYGPMHPLTIPAAARVLAPLSGPLGLALAAALALLAVGSLVVRYRKSETTGTRQLQLLSLAAAVMAVTWIAGNGVKAFVRLPAAGADLISIGLGLTLAAVAVAIGVAILRGNLIDMGQVVSRSLAYAALVAAITVIFVLLVTAAGVTAGGRFPVPLAVLLTAVVAVTFEPFRVRAQRLANRVVYGPRAEPCEILAGFVRTVSTSLPVDDAVNRMARVLAEGTRSRRAEVQLRPRLQPVRRRARPAGRRCQLRPFTGFDFAALPHCLPPGIVTAGVRS